MLIGANNAGKTSFLDSLFVGIGAGRKSVSADDVRLDPGELTAPKTREVLIDLMIRPVGDDGKVADTYPEGSFWIGLWRGPAWPQLRTNALAREVEVTVPHDATAVLQARRRRISRPAAELCA